MKLPKRFSYTRSISPSNCVFLIEGTEPLQVHKVTLTTSMEGAAQGASETKASVKKSIDNEASLPADLGTHNNLGRGNIQTVETCYVPYGTRRLVCNFSVSVNANSTSPHVCSDKEVISVLSEFLSLYKARGGFRYLAERYLENIISGAWLWRNQHTLGTKIVISTNRTEPVCAEHVEQLRFNTNFFKKLPGWIELLEAFETALTEPSQFLICEVSGEIQPSTCQEIYPSQAFIQDESNTGDNSQPKSKKSLAKVFQKTSINGVESPILGSYKIGAAIATIDDWYDDGVEPLRVSNYGVNKAEATAVRHPRSGKDLFSIMKNLESISASIQSSGQLPPEAHFLVANLIKGGLFQKEKEDLGSHKKGDQ